MIYIDTEQGKVDIFSTASSDFQLADEQTISSKNYVICFTERSGSTMLCSILKATGVLGMPEEYLNPRGSIQLFLDKYPASNILQYFDALRRHQISTNGVFGIKTCFIDFEPLINHQMISKLLNPVKFIYLMRKDIVLQAISAYVARCSGIWHLTEDGIITDGQEIKSDCEYDEAAILSHVDRLIYERMQWERFFALYSIDPLRVAYEEVLEEPEKLVRHIAKFLGEDISIRVGLDMSATRKIGGGRNQEWAEQIRSKFVL